MSIATFIFQGKIYKAQVGELIAFNSDVDVPGDGILISTADYDIYAQKISSDASTSILRIEKVVPAHYPLSSTDMVQVPIKQLPEKPKLTQYTKQQLIDFAQSIGIEIMSKLTKKEIIALINMKYEER